MTWGKAAPVLALCVAFDLLRTFFSLFWLFGPALGAAYCTSTVNIAAGTDIAGGAGQVVAGLCTGVAVAAGVAFSAAITWFGVIMAMAIGLFGWLLVYTILIVSNGRIFRENSSSILMTLLSLGTSELPFINALPALTLTTGRLYHTQIKMEKKRLQKWKQEQVQIAQREYQQQYMQMSQERQIEDEEIPEELKMAA